MQGEKLIAKLYYRLGKAFSTQVYSVNRFRDTFLTFGGTCHFSEVFRRFRGRDPKPEILLQYIGLSEDVKGIVDDEKNSNEDPKLIVTC